MSMSTSPLKTTVSTADDKSKYGLESLVAWLRSFPQLKNIPDENQDPGEFIGQETVASAILQVACEVFSCSASSDENDKTWPAIFRIVKAQDPSVLETLTETRVSEQELRLVLVSAILSRAVTCSDRRNYISRIMSLSPTVQQVLMAIIEKSQRNTRTPQRSSSSQVATTPKSSGSSQIIRQETCTTSSSVGRLSASQSPTRPRRIVKGTPEQRSALERRQDMDALLSWLGTFPELTSFGKEDLQDIENAKVAGAILSVVETMNGKGSTNDHIVQEKALAVWDRIELAVAKMVPLMPHSVGRAFCMERPYSILSTLLCYSVSDSCPERKHFIGRILELPPEHQHRLMKLIEHGKNFMSPLRETPRFTGRRGGGTEVTSRQSTPPTDRSRGRMDLVLSPSGYTPQRKKASLVRTSGEGLFSPATIDSSLERMVKELRKQNGVLKKELRGAQQREMDLGEKIQSMETKFRRETFKLESSALRREEDMRQDHEQRVVEMQQELKEMKDAQVMEERAQHELASVREELELFEHTQAKLTETEMKLQKCRERIEELVDAKEALQREEEAHGASVEECLRLENELKALQPLRRQLEDYKTRAINAEVKLAECQEDLKRKEQESLTINSAHTELLKGARLQQDEAEELRQRLSNEQNAERDPNGHALADGMSELNPAVKEEMLRLRNDNIQLKAFAAKREDDSVQKMEESLDDVRRLSDKYKEEFFAVKEDLELSRQELSQSKLRESDLQYQLAGLTSKFEETENVAKEYSDRLEIQKDELKEKCRQLTEAEERERSLKANVDDLNMTIQGLKSDAQKRTKHLESTLSALDSTSASLVQSTEDVARLKKDIAERAEKVNESEKACSLLQTQCEGLRLTLAETETQLESSRKCEATLERATTALTAQVVGLEGKLKEQYHLHEEEMKTVEDNTNDLKQNLEKKLTKEVANMQASMTAVLEKERESYREQLEKATNDYQQLNETAKASTEAQREELEERLRVTTGEYEGQLRVLNEKYDKDMEDIRTKAAEEREQLITRGKAMLKDAKERAEEEINTLDDELQETMGLLDKTRLDFTDHQGRTREKVAAYKQKLQFASGRMSQLEAEVDDLQESVKATEREKFKLQEENESFRRQLGGRFGADGKVQNQLDMLQKEFNAVLDENRQLKKDIANAGSTFGSSESEGSAYRTRGSTRNSTLSHLRKEFEETIEALNDEKRELVMKNSAAITDVQKAEQRAWMLEKDVARLKQEITSLNLSLQRSERLTDGMYAGQDESMTQEHSYHTCEEDAKENNLSMTQSAKGTPSQLLVDISSTAPHPVATSPPLKSILSPSAKANTPSHRSNEQYTNRKLVDASEIRSEDVAPKRRDFASQEKCPPSLMDYVKVDGDAGVDAQPECKQS